MLPRCRQPILRILCLGSDATGGGAYSTDRPATARTFTFSLLQRRTGYTFTVAAITAAGVGPAAAVRFSTG